MQSIEFGKTVSDLTTGFSGKVIGFAVYSTGCKQYLVAPPVGKSGEWRDSQWFDDGRLGVEGPANGGPVENAPAPR